MAYRTSADGTHPLRADVKPGLYAILDADSLGARPLIPFARRVLAAGELSSVQLRAKSWTTRELTDTARALVPMCASKGIPLLVNDRVDVALVSGAAGVHVGMRDLPVADVRAIGPGLSVGVSSHDPEEVGLALATDADYIAFGPVYGTRSKSDAAPTVGVDALRTVVHRAGTRPVVAIGGITMANAEEIRRAGARAGAVIAALVVPDDQVTSVARAFHRALGGEG